MDRKINLMGIEVDHISFQTLKRMTAEYLMNDTLNRFILLSTKLIEEALKDPELADSLKEVDYLLPGEDHVYGTAPDFLPEKGMVTGYHSLLELLGKMEKHHTVYLMAPNEGHIKKITTYCDRHFAKIRIVGNYNQKEEWTDEQLLNAINSVSPDVLINTIPSPVEGKWVSTFGQQINAKLYIGLGGIFDTMVSELKPPPFLIRKLHLLSLYHKLRGRGQYKLFKNRIFRSKVEQYNTKKR